MQIERYQGTPDRPFPPSPLGFREIDVPFTDEARRARAAGLLGELPPWSFVDEPGPGGVTRYYAFEHPLGRSVGAVFLRPDRPLLEGTLGQTNPNFVAPAPGAAANTVGAALSAAALALLNYFDSSGVPSEHVDDQQVLAFQTTWNADPIASQVANNNGMLEEDGGYGANTYSALAAIVGSVAPAVNTGPAPSGTTPVTPSPTPAAPAVQQASVASSSGMGTTAAVILGVLVVGGLVTAGLAAKHPIRF